MQTRFKTFVLSLAAAATLAGLAGCSSTDDRTVGRKIDDRMVTSRVKDALDDATVYKFEDVRVATRNGVVQLSGWAANEDQKARAGEIAQKVEGVHEVINNISIKLVPTGRENTYPPRDETKDASPKTDAPVKSPDDAK